MATVNVSSINGLEQKPPIDDAQLSLSGIRMLLNNEWTEAEALFSKYKDYSPLMSAGSSFVTFLQALMTFDDDKMEAASAALQATSAFCKSYIDGSQLSSLESKLQCEIIIADCVLYQAGLTVVNQDIPSYIRGGWHIRRAWQSYRKLYTRISRLHEESFRDDTAPSEDEPRLSRSAAARLLGSISFGYGAFELFISLIPPNILWLIQVLGFEGDQTLGLHCLEVASHSEDMKAPIATLMLVWYHCVVRPFFSLDGENFAAGIDEANRTLDRTKKDYPKSALFLYFKSRIYRLQNNNEEALTICRHALSLCANQRETQHICFYEIGRMCMMQLEWEESTRCFIRLREESQWSKSFYGYLYALCQGAMGELDASTDSMRLVPKLVKRKGSQVESFVYRRASLLLKSPPSRQYMTLLALEMLYMWTVIPNCANQYLVLMLQVCSSQTVESPLRCLIEGAVHKQLGDVDKAEQSFQHAVTLYTSGDKTDQHAAAFACFELALLQGQQPNGLPASKLLYLQTKNNYKNYDFEQRLSVKVNTALKRLQDVEVDDQSGRSCSVQ